MLSFPQSSFASQRGFTLVEVLVTVVVISVGLLGVAALQLTTLRGNHDASVRLQASILAADILDRMRANPASFRNGLYDVDYNGEGTAATAAGNDLRSWQLAIDQLLPGGDDRAAGRIERVEDVARRHIVTVTIRWLDRANGSDGTSDDSSTREFRTRSEI